MRVCGVSGTTHWPQQLPQRTPSPYPSTSPWHRGCCTVAMGGEHLEQRQKSSEVYEKDMVDALLDEMEDTTSQFGISNEHISSLLWTILMI